MYGPAASKVALWVMILLGFGTYFGIQYAVIPDPPIGKELVSIGIFIFGLGVAWATVKADIKAVRSEIEASNTILRTDIKGKIRLMQHKYETLSKRVSNVEHEKKNSNVNGD